jgi:hypothetical protein
MAIQLGGHPAKGTVPKLEETGMFAWWWNSVQLCKSNDCKSLLVYFQSANTKNKSCKRRIGVVGAPLLMLVDHPSRVLKRTED